MEAFELGLGTGHSSGSRFSKGRHDDQRARVRAILAGGSGDADRPVRPAGLGHEVLTVTVAATNGSEGPSRVRLAGKRDAALGPETVTEHFRQ